MGKRTGRAATVAVTLGLIVGCGALVSQQGGDEAYAARAKAVRTGRSGRRTKATTTVATTVPTTPPTTLPTTPPTTAPTTSSSSSSSSSSSTTAPGTRTSTPSTSTPSGVATFLETFDGKPTAPLAWHPANWDVQYHSRDIGTWVSPPAVDGHHGATCSPSPDVHPITTWEDSTYVCLDHGHTAINTPGYGEIMLTPDALVDFSQEPGVVRWSTSTLITSTRDWTDVWITPWDDNLALPLWEWLPDLQGEPLRAVHVSMDFGHPRFLIEVVRDHTTELVGTLEWPATLVQSQRDREPFRIDLTRTGLTLSMPLHDTSTTVSFADLGWSQGVVQFGHHSYNPTKDGAGYANSWGWDDISISPAVGFSMQQLQPRILTEEGALDFGAPAVAGTKLRFSGICAIDLDFGGGWQRAATQAQEKHLVEHFSSYFVDVPTGATSVKARFSGDGWYDGFDCALADAALWHR